MTLDVATAVKRAFDAYADDRLAVIDPDSIDVGRLQRPDRRQVHRSRSRALRVAAVCLLLVVCAATAWVATRPSQEATPPAATAVLAVAGFTFDYPASLVRHDPEESLRGPASILAYLTDQDVVSSCQTTTTAAAVDIRCRGPIQMLAPDKTLVRFTASSLFGVHAGTTTSTTTIAGLPADIQQGPAEPDCPAGAASEITATIPYEAYGSGGALIVTGCFGPDAVTQQAFTAMLRSAHYTPATP